METLKKFLKKLARFYLHLDIVDEKKMIRCHDVMTKTYSPAATYVLSLLLIFTSVYSDHMTSTTLMA